MLQELFNLPANLPVVASEHGADVDNFIIYIHWLMAALFIGWSSYYIYVLWRFNGKKNKKADYHGARTHVSSYLEVAVAIVEVVLLTAFAIPMWAKVVEEVPKPEESTQIRVMAQQFAWNFMHPGADDKFGKQAFDLVSEENKFGRDLEDENGKDDIFTLNEIHLPVDKKVVFHTSSLDVIHSFKVIAMRICQDTIPGMSIPVWCEPLKVGRYQINCAQLCGNGHTAMTGGFLNVDSQEDYDAWLAQNTPADGEEGAGALSFE
ncbi:MAG: cytochrome c oxidase subunit II [Verrucomicrobia bacterium]|nr:cytochrome c oxidase subunit II [Verrucomicrobiota bacterium]